MKRKVVKNNSKSYTQIKSQQWDFMDCEIDRLYFGCTKKLFC